MKNQARSAPAAATPPKDDAPHAMVSSFPSEAVHEPCPDEPVTNPLPSVVASRRAGSARTSLKNPAQRPCCTGPSISTSTG